MFKNFARTQIHKLMTASLRATNKQRGESDLKRQLYEIVPDISAQYTAATISPDDIYMTEKVRCLHAFQTKLALDALELAKKKLGRKRFNVVDIGDSSGTHLSYLSQLTKPLDIEIEAISINLDPVAVEKVRQRGIRAELCRAEELHERPDGVRADLFLMYETLEHLTDPIGFMRMMALKASCTYFVISVPYVTQSRLGLGYIRRNWKTDALAENTHVFELSPADWNLLFRFSGWRIVESNLYCQYPKKRLLSPTKYVWRRLDYDGFYGVILEQDLSVSNQYKSWN